MTKIRLLSSPTNPRDVYLKPAEVLARFDWRHSYGYRMLASAGFPQAIGGRYRLDTVLAWEDRVLSGELSGRPDPAAKDTADADHSNATPHVVVPDQPAVHPVARATASGADTPITAAPTRRRTRGTRKDA